MIKIGISIEEISTKIAVVEMDQIVSLKISNEQLFKYLVKSEKEFFVESFNKMLNDNKLISDKNVEVHVCLPSNLFRIETIIRDSLPEENWSLLKSSKSKDLFNNTGLEYDIKILSVKEISKGKFCFTMICLPNKYIELISNIDEITTIQSPYNLYAELFSDDDIQVIVVDDDQKSICFFTYLKDYGATSLKLHETIDFENNDSKKSLSQALFQNNIHVLSVFGINDYNVKHFVFAKEYEKLINLAKTLEFDVRAIYDNSKKQLFANCLAMIINQNNDKGDEIVEKKSVFYKLFARKINKEKKVSASGESVNFKFNFINRFFGHNNRIIK